MQQLLIVEDDKELNKGLCLALKSVDRQVIGCLNLQSAREQFMVQKPTLIVLDINLPDGSGLDFLREVKEKDLSIPVILLTANDTDVDIVEGLEQGADDYITKPFSLVVLRARVNTQLRKSNIPATDTVFKMGKFIFDFENMIFFVNDLQVELSKTEQKLLRLLTANVGISMSRSELVDRIWTDGSEYVDENALSVTVKRLRDKLDAANYIKTIYGIGYMWVKTDE